MVLIDYFPLLGGTTQEHVHLYSHLTQALENVREFPHVPVIGELYSRRQEFARHLCFIHKAVNTELRHVAEGGVGTVPTKWI